MNVLMISPGYPAEMAFFTRGLGQAGVTVIGLGDQSPDALPAEARTALDHYVHTSSLAAEEHVLATVRGLAKHVRIDQVECLWEPYMVLAARLREALGLPPSVAWAVVSGPAAGELLQPLLAGEFEGLVPLDEGRWLLRAPDHQELCDALGGLPRPKGRVRIEVDPLRI